MQNPLIPMGFLIRCETISEFRHDRTNFLFPPIKWNKMEMAPTATVLSGSRSSFHQRSVLYRATKSASFGPIKQLFIFPNRGSTVLKRCSMDSELSKARQYSFEVKQYILRMKRSKAVQFCSKAVNIQFLSEAVQIQNEVKWGGTVLNQSSMDSERSKVRQYSFKLKQYKFRSKQSKAD